MVPCCALGLPTETDEEVEAAARKLMEAGVKQVLVKLGPNGSLLLQGAKCSGSRIQGTTYARERKARKCRPGAYLRQGVCLSWLQIEWK